MEVRVTPTKPIIGRNEFPSTNISSPIQARARPRKRIQQFAYGAEDDSESAFDPVHTTNSDEDDDGFAPVREGRRSTAPKKQLGPPITADEQLSHLSNDERDLVEQFVDGAKKVCKDIQLKKNLRSQPFSDTALREIGMRLPADQDALLEVPGINPDMAERYGKKIIPLVKDLIDIHGTTPMAKAPGVSKKARKSSKKTEVPEDPNHRVVVNLVSSESEPEAETDAESDYGSFGESDDEAGETSPYFADGADDFTDQKKVAEYNRTMSQLDQMRATTTPAPAATSTYGGRGGGKAFGSKGPFSGSGRGKGGKPYSSGSRKRSSSGAVAKKTTARKPRKGSSKSGGAARGGSGSGNRRGGGGAAGGAASSWGAIMAMPT